MVIARISNLLGKITILVICCYYLPAQAKYGGGTGDSNDPYLIKDANQMNAIGADSNDWDKHFKLMADIDLSQYLGDQFNIIGIDYDNPFTGVFDGNDHAISNFTYTCTSTNFIGIFGYVDGETAEIKDLGLLNANIDAGTGGGVGSLVGMNNCCRITNCFVEGGSVSGDSTVGGLVGNNYGGRSIMTDCHSSIDVVAGEDAGGLVGINFGTITNSYSSATASGNERIGGLVGCNHGSFRVGIITDCCSTGSISGNKFVGGLVGESRSGTVITNCYSTGSVTGDRHTGGLVGLNSGRIISSCSEGSIIAGSEVGGLVGNNYTGSITNCYSNKSVSGIYASTGGLVGLNWGSITKCYSTGSVSGNGGLVGATLGHTTASFWDVETSGQESSAGGTGLPTAEMQMKITFTDAGWDFINIWDIGENQTYPYLRVYLAADLNKDGIVNFLDVAVTANQWMEEQQ